MNIIFFEDDRKPFLPLVFTKPISKLRIGILTIEEKWQKAFEANNSPTTSYLTEDYLSEKFPVKVAEENLFINSRCCPNKEIVGFIENKLSSNEALFVGQTMIVAKCTMEQYQNSSYHIHKDLENIISTELKHATDIFLKNGEELVADYQLLTAGRKSQAISATNTVIGSDIFVEEGVEMEAATLNAKEGPIYIGKNSQIMEGSLVRGPFALCDYGVLKLGTKIYGPTTVGPYSKVGGEVNNCVIQSYSNKGHDGFMGNSVIGDWCNLGADTNTSNLKNNYGSVKQWSYATESYEDIGLQFCGLVMGDHSKCGINTMFNTGTTIGVSANIFGGEFPPKFIPSFSWGGASKLDTYQIEKSFEVAHRVMERRELDLLETDRKILTAIFEKTAKFRK